MFSFKGEILPRLSARTATYGPTLQTDTFGSLTPIRRVSVLFYLGAKEMFTRRPILPFLRRFPYVLGIERGKVYAFKCKNVMHILVMDYIFGYSVRVEGKICEH